MPTAIMSFPSGPGPYLTTSPGAVETSGTSVSVSPRGSVLRNNSWGLFGSSTMDDSTTTFLNSSWRSRTLVTARLSASTSKFSGVNSK